MKKFHLALGQSNSKGCQLTEKCKHEEHVDLSYDDVLEDVVELPVAQLMSKHSQDLIICATFAFQTIFTFLLVIRACCILRLL